MNGHCGELSLQCCIALIADLSRSCLCASVCKHITLKPHHSPPRLKSPAQPWYTHIGAAAHFWLMGPTQHCVSTSRPCLTNMSCSSCICYCGKTNSYQPIKGLIRQNNLEHLCGCAGPLSVICFSNLCYWWSHLQSPFCNVPKAMERKSIHFNFAFHMKHIQAWKVNKILTTSY